MIDHIPTPHPGPRGERENRSSPASVRSVATSPHWVSVVPNYPSPFLTRSEWLPNLPYSLGHEIPAWDGQRASGTDHRCLRDRNALRVGFPLPQRGEGLRVRGEPVGWAWAIA